MKKTILSVAISALFIAGLVSTANASNVDVNKFINDYQARSTTGSGLSWDEVHAEYSALNARDRQVINSVAGKASLWQVAGWARTAPVAQAVLGWNPEASQAKLDGTYGNLKQAAPTPQTRAAAINTMLQKQNTTIHALGVAVQNGETENTAQDQHLTAIDHVNKKQNDSIHALGYAINQNAAGNQAEDQHLNALDHANQKQHDTNVALGNAINNNAHENDTQEQHLDAIDRVNHKQHETNVAFGDAINKNASDNASQDAQIKATEDVDARQDQHLQSIDAINNDQDASINGLKDEAQKQGKTNRAFGDAINANKQAASDAQNTANNAVNQVNHNAQGIADNVTSINGLKDENQRQGQINHAFANAIQKNADTDAYAQKRADDAFANAAANRQALESTNKKVAANSGELADHESRIQSLEANSSANFAKLKNEVDENRQRASAGIAGVAAMANIPQVIQGQTFAVGAGVGNTDGESALAVGFSARASQNVVVKASVSNDTQQNFVVGAGASVGW